MKEKGVDISHHFSKGIKSIIDINFDYVVTVCSQAEQSCPVFPRKTQVTHVSFDDPPILAKYAQNDDEALPHFRHVRDEIRVSINNFSL
jgi:arsenate reductase (thioredoxin)